MDDIARFKMFCQLTPGRSDGSGDHLIVTEPQIDIARGQAPCLGSATAKGQTLVKRRLYSFF